MAHRKLLVADDSLTIQKVIRLALSNEGYEIQAVSSGKDAVEQILLFRPDVVLIDASLPQKSAFEIKTEIEQTKDIRPPKFILMASAFDELNEQEILEASFEGRLVKPFDPAHLRQVLTDVLKIQGGSTSMSSDIWGNTGTNPEISNMDQEEDDIKQLADETFKITSVGTPSASEWSIQEKGTSKKSTSLADEVGEKTLAGMWIKEPSLQPPPNLMDAGGSTFNLGSGEIELEGNYTPAPFVPPQPPSKTSKPAKTSAAATASFDTPETSSLSKSEMEEIIAKQFSKAIEKLAQKTLPEIAEKIIRQEINKILSNL